MGFSMELVKARRRVAELEAKVAEQQADIIDYLELLAYGIEKPSPADIVKETGITTGNHQILIDLTELNIPFAETPKVVPMFSIPDTGSMDGIFDYGNSELYIEPANEENHKIMVDWIAKQWLDSKGLNTVDAVYRVMVNEADDPKDFYKVAKWYAIHRLIEVGIDDNGRFFWFAGINNPMKDPFLARDGNILWLSIGTVY